MLKLCNAADLRIVTKGGGTKMSWGNPPQGIDVILSTRKLNRIIEHAAGDLTATVQAGCTVATLQKKLSEHRQWLALDPLWPKHIPLAESSPPMTAASIRAAYGTIRDQLIGVTVVLADGTIAQGGGKVVKNVAGYDLPKLFTGTRGRSVSFAKPPPGCIPHRAAKPSD